MSWRSCSLIATCMPCCCTVSFSPKYATSNTQWAMCVSGKMSILLLPLTGCSTNPGPTTIETYFDDLEPDFQKFLQHSHGNEHEVTRAPPTSSSNTII
jgi:hypothetical protein